MRKIDPAWNRPWTFSGIPGKISAKDDFVFISIHQVGSYKLPCFNKSSFLKICFV